MIEAWKNAEWGRCDIALTMGMCYIELIFVSCFIPALWFIVLPWAIMFYYEIRWQCKIRNLIEGRYELVE